MIKYFCDACKKELKDVDGNPERGNRISLESISMFKPRFTFELCEECYDKILETINAIFKEYEDENNNKD